MEGPSTFDSFPLSEPVQQAITDAEYDTPTDSQIGTIPLVLAGIDLIVQSQTGSGKTAAFAIPIAEMLDTSVSGVQALALAPTRELALQVTRELARMGCNAKGLNVVTVYGGASISEQIRLVKTAAVIVATPGRMLDLLRRKAVTFEEVRFFVLDEADEMLSMGFEKEVRDIVDYLPEERQSLMFSATVSESIRGVAADLLSYPEFVAFGSDTQGAEEVDHFYYMVSGVGRLKDLHRVIQFEEPGNALIFCNTRDDSFRVANYLKRQGYDADVLNGELPQKEREKVMGQMKAGRLRFMVATDIAARGIDISFLPSVINFTLPESAESYIHRTGRTGRAGREGVAISLIAPREIGMFYQLRRAYKFDLKARVLPSDKELVAIRERRILDQMLDGLDANEDLNYGACLSFADAFDKLPDRRQRLAKLMAFFIRERDRQRAEAEKAEQAKKAEEAEREEKAKQAEQQKSAERAPEKEVETASEPPADPPNGAAEPSGKGRARAPRQRRSGKERGKVAKEPNGEKHRPQRTRSSNSSSPRRAHKGMAKLRVNMGRDMVDSPEGLVSLLAELSGMGREDLGTARIFAKHSIVEVRNDLADDIIQAVDRERVGEHELLVSR